MKIRNTLFLLFALFTLNMAPANGPSEFVGHWQGVADGQINFTIDITMEDEVLSAVLNAPEQGMVDVKSTEMTVSGDHDSQISFNMPDGATLVMSGGLAEDGTFSGDYVYGEQFGSFTMAKKED